MIAIEKLDLLEELNRVFWNGSSTVHWCSSLHQWNWISQERRRDPTSRGHLYHRRERLEQILPGCLPVLQILAHLEGEKSGTDVFFYCMALESHNLLGFSLPEMMDDLLVLGGRAQTGCQRRQNVQATKGWSPSRQPLPITFIWMLVPNPFGIPC